MYRYRCSNNVNTYLYEHQLEDFSCDEDCQCGSNFNLREAIENEIVDVPIFFEIDNQLKIFILNLEDDSFQFNEEGGVSRSSGTVEFMDDEIAITLLAEIESKPLIISKLIDSRNWRNTIEQSKKR